MPIRTRATVTDNTQGFNTILNEYATSTFKEASVKAFNRVEDDILALFREYPRPRDNSRFVWSKDRQANKRARGWWFANLRKGTIPTDGKHYRRSGKLGRAWQVRLDLSSSATSIDLVILNNARDDNNKARYRWVTGTFDKARGKRWQIIGHRRTGWYTSIDRADEAFNLYISTLRRSFGDVLSERRNR